MAKTHEKRIKAVTYLGEVLCPVTRPGEKRNANAVKMHQKHNAPKQKCICIVAVFLQWSSLKAAYQIKHL